MERLIRFCITAAHWATIITLLFATCLVSHWNIEWLSAFFGILTGLDLVGGTLYLYACEREPSNIALISQALAELLDRNAPLSADAEDVS